MTAPSLIAFALVFVVANTLISLTLGLGLRATARRLRTIGARAERRAATLVLLIPPTLALVLVGSLAVNSAKSLVDGTDHCAAHAHHLHLCLVHGAAWANRPWAVELLAVFGCFIVVRLSQILWAHWMAQRAAWKFRRLGDPLPGTSRAVLIPVDEPIAFTTGALSPTVVISRGAWNGLEPNERTAVLAHELAHVAGGDIWRRALLTVAACFVVPGLTSYALRLWDRSTELVCDSRAADVVRQPSIVAGAIVSLARGMKIRGQAPIGAVFAAAYNVAERVECLLDGEPDDGQSATRLSLWFLCASVGFALGLAVLAGRLHHLLETFLG